MHSAEDDDLGLGALGDPREPEGVASGVGEVHDLVHLVVVAEDQETITERVLCRGDPFFEFLG